MGGSPVWLPYAMLGIALVGWSVTGLVCMYQTRTLGRVRRELQKEKAAHHWHAQRGDHWRDVAQWILPQGTRRHGRVLRPGEDPRAN